jgi:hypothetical protein
LCVFLSFRKNFLFRRSDWRRRESDVADVVKDQRWRLINRLHLGLDILAPSCSHTLLFPV